MHAWEKSRGRHLRNMGALIGTKGRTANEGALGKSGRVSWFLGKGRENCSTWDAVEVAMSHECGTTR